MIRPSDDNAFHESHVSFLSGCCNILGSLLPSRTDVVCVFTKESQKLGELSEYRTLVDRENCGLVNNFEHTHLVSQPPCPLMPQALLTSNVAVETNSWRCLLNIRNAPIPTGASNSLHSMPTQLR